MALFHVFMSVCVLSSLYTYDMRYLERPVLVHIDHVSAVLDVDYSPTGTEFVSASFDKTIRIFPKDSDRSRLVTADFLLVKKQNKTLIYFTVRCKIQRIYACCGKL